MKIRIIIMLALALLFTGGCALKGLRLVNGLVELDEGHIITPSVGKVGSLVKNDDGFGIDLLHFEREGLDSEPKHLSLEGGE